MEYIEFYGGVWWPHVYPEAQLAQRHGARREEAAQQLVQTQRGYAVHHTLNIECCNAADLAILQFTRFAPSRQADARRRPSSFQTA